VLSLVFAEAQERLIICERKRTPMPLKTLQIAVLGGSEDAVLVGLRNFPAHKLILLSTSDSLDQANQLSKKLTETLKLTVDVKQLSDATISSMLETVGQVVRAESGSFQDFLINVGSAGQHQTCAGVTAAFVHGIKAFDVVSEQPIVLPVMKFSYTQAVTEPKMEILRAIERSGGDVESLEKLSALSNYGKPLLSYHIRGSEEGRGLEDLGLVEVERGKRGRLRVKLTALGRTLLSTSPAK
jgi:DNA-binding MarR family transcriptional regulator